MGKKLLPGTFTVGLIKYPTCLNPRAIEAVKRELAAAGLSVRHSFHQQFDGELADKFYCEHALDPAKVWYPAEFRPFMTGHPVIALLIVGPDAVEKWRTILGDTNPLATDASGLRREFGISLMPNGFHGSADPEAATREAMLLWGSPYLDEDWPGKDKVKSVPANPELVWLEASFSELLVEQLHKSGLSIQGLCGGRLGANMVIAGLDAYRIVKLLAPGKDFLSGEDAFAQISVAFKGDDSYLEWLRDNYLSPT